MAYYGFTIRRTSPIKTTKKLENVKSDYTYFIKRYLPSETEYHYEIAPDGEGYNVHIHGVFYSRDFDRSKIKFKKGYHLWFDVINYRLWNIYITKQNIDYLTIYTIIENHEELQDPEDNIRKAKLTAASESLSNSGPDPVGDEIPNVNLFKHIRKTQNSRKLK